LLPQGLFGEQDPVNFGRLSQALFCMFQMTTGRQG
jgi:hypothetical protein